MRVLCSRSGWCRGLRPGISGLGDCDWPGHHDISGHMASPIIWEMYMNDWNGYGMKYGVKRIWSRYTTIPERLESSTVLGILFGNGWSRRRTRFTRYLPPSNPYMHAYIHTDQP
jgi:hypothetical protein